MHPRLTCYWQTWNLPGRPALPLTEVPKGYTDVTIAFAAPDDEGVLRLSGPNVPKLRDVRTLQARGQCVLLSIGGGGVAVTLDTNDKVERFSESLYRLVRTLGLNGVDIDVEQGMPAPASPRCLEGTGLGLARGIDMVLSALPPDFMLTLAPETANLVGAISRYGGDWGNYIPLISHFGERITSVHMQHYNSGTMLGIDGNIYSAGTIEFVVALTDALIKGFDIADTGCRFEGLPPHKVAIGLPATPQAAGNGYLSPLEVREAFWQILTGCRDGRSECIAGHTNIGGLMTWSAQWDETNDFEFMRNGECVLRMIR